MFKNSDRRLTVKAVANMCADAIAEMAYVLCAIMVVIFTALVLIYTSYKNHQYESEMLSSSYVYAKVKTEDHSEISGYISDDDYEKYLNGNIDIIAIRGASYNSYDKTIKADAIKSIETEKKNN